MAQCGPPRPLFSMNVSRGRRKRPSRYPEGFMEAGGPGEAQQWAEGWCRPPPPRRTRWGPELPQAEGPGMPPPDWGSPGQGPPPPWGRGFPPREGREGPWPPPESQRFPPQDPRWRDWGDEDGPSREGPWDRPYPQRWGGPPPRNSRWESFGNAGGGSSGGPPASMGWGPSGPGNDSDRWGNCPEWGGPEDPGDWSQPPERWSQPPERWSQPPEKWSQHPEKWSQHPGESSSKNPGRGSQGSPERWGGEPQSLGQENRSWGNPEMRQPSPSCEKGGWGPSQKEPREQHSGSRGQPVQEPFHTDSARNESKWRGAERRGEECLSPDRARGQKNPTGDHRSWGISELECSGSAGSRSQPVWEQSQSNLRVGERDIPKRGGGEHASTNTGKREWGCPEILNKQPSSDRVQQDYYDSARSEGGESPDESQVDTGMREQEIKEECSDTEDGSLERSGSPPPSSNSAAPKPWAPREQVVSWWMRCQGILRSKTRQQFLSVCPRPTLPEGTSETPCLNGGILNLLGKQQMTELVTGSLTLWQVQDEVLDMLAPALTIYEIAEEAVESDKLVDPMELREWIRQLVRHIGSINQRLTLHRRLQLLSLINPRLKTLSSKLVGQSTNGMLFAEDKAKLLLEILKRFPQLSGFKGKQTARKKVPFKNTAAYKGNQSFSTSQARYRYRSRHSGSKAYMSSTENRTTEQNHR
ncbi:filaggrin-2-like [Tiliqua scincoides]|uniref:filaggrin-2-like n=1 Tax=Tiliqua scincoides TaxID=71010 RepID=UPI0034627DFD